MNETERRGIRTRVLFPLITFIFSLVTAQSPGLLLAEEAPPDRVLTLDDSVRLASNNSQALLTSHEDVDIANQRVREAESLFFPSLDLNANWSKFRVEDNTPLLLQPALGPTLIPNFPQQNFYTGQANIYQPVYTGGRLRNTWRQARISYERARAINEALQTQVSSAAKQAFYDLLFAQEKNRQYQDALRTMEPLVANQESGSLGERLKVEDELALLRTSAAEASLGEEEARLAYLQTLNLELSTNIQLDGKLETHPVEINLQKMLAWSMEYRSEVRQTEYQQELDALDVSLSLAERDPTVGFGATYVRTGTDINLQTANWAGTLNINLPVSISDMFFGRTKVRERRAEYRQATLKHAETADQIQLQVREAYTKCQFWQAQLEPRKSASERLAKLVEAARREHVTLPERLEAERLLLESQVRYEEAVHGHLTALASMERAVGHSLSPEQ